MESWQTFEHASSRSKRRMGLVFGAEYDSLGETRKERHGTIQRPAMRFHRFAVAVLISSLTLLLNAQRRVPTDLSTVRGFNFQSAQTIGHAEFWHQYNPAVTERDLDFARRLQLNQVRVFVPYAAWEKNKVALRKNLLHFVRAAHECGIGVMPTMQFKFGEWKDRAAWADARNLVGP